MVITKVIKIYKNIVSLFFSLFIKVSEHEREKRITICQDCDAKEWNEDFQLWSCGKYLMGNKSKDTNQRTCGCDIYQKTKLKLFHCPRKLW